MYSGSSNSHALSCYNHNFDACCVYLCDILSYFCIVEINGWIVFSFPFINCKTIHLTLVLSPLKHSNASQINWLHKKIANINKLESLSVGEKKKTQVRVHNFASSPQCLPTHTGLALHKKAFVSRLTSRFNMNIKSSPKIQLVGRSKY